MNQGTLSRQDWNRLSAIGLAPFLVLWTAAVLYFDAMILLHLGRQTASLFYPQVRGVILRSNANDEGPRLDLTYAYTVGGQPYIGTRYLAHGWNAGEGEAALVARSLPPGTPVDVSYAPWDPSQALLRPGVDLMSLYVPLFLVPFNILMIGGWVIVVCELRELLRDPPVTVPVEQVGPLRSVRSKSWSPVVRPMVAAGAVGFAGMFIVGMSVDHIPAHAPRVVLALWIVLIAATAIVRWVTRRQSVVVILDAADRMVRLPRGLHRSHALEIPYEAVTGTAVEPTFFTDVHGQPQESWAAVVVFRGEDGTAGRAPIAGRFNEFEAESLALWLGEATGLESETAGNRPAETDTVAAAERP